MSGACLAFGLLLWFPGLLNAQTAGRPCQAPELGHGYFVPEKATYLHEELITYACDKGYKRVVGGWWGTSKCLNGNWSHTPLCIDENNCGPPTILNGKYSEDPEGWYEEGEVIRVTCNPGLEHKNRAATAKCINGTWSSFPVCVKMPEACLHPPKIPHGVIIGEPYRDLFEVDSSVKYTCEKGYTMEGPTSGDTIFCIFGNWTDVPKCIKTSGQVGGPYGSTAHEKHANSKPGTSPGTSVETSTKKKEFPSGSTNIKDQYTTILNCGRRPTVYNGALVQSTTSHLMYQCVRLYKLVGSNTVYCQSSGLWTQVPTCQANYCHLDTSMYPLLEDTRTHFLEINEKMVFKCVHMRGWHTEHYAQAHCSSSRTVTFTKCCGKFTPWYFC